MADKVSFDDGQLKKLLDSIEGLADHAPYWKHFLIAAVPIFLASLLGLATALILDWLKTRREGRKVNRERLEKELALLNVINTAIAFNISALIHTTMQQILPHHEQSHAALSAIEALKSKSLGLREFHDLLHTSFQAMITRCPEPYLEEVNLIRDLPFLVEREPNVLMVSGFINTYTRDLKAILNSRNKIIDKVTVDNGSDEIGFPAIEFQITTQATISNIEVVNAFQLFRQYEEVSRKIEDIIGNEYKQVVGPKLKINPPDVLGSVMVRLEGIARSVVPNWPPEPPAA